MIVTAILSRWANGWSEVTHPDAITANGRSEGFLSLGAVQSREEMTAVCSRQLDIFGDPRTEIATDLEPLGNADTPYVAFGVGDRVTVPDLPGHAPSLERVKSITVSMDDNGKLTYAPELRDNLLDERERFAETIAKMAQGTLGGDSRVATPASFVTSANSAPLRLAAASAGGDVPGVVMFYAGYNTEAVPTGGGNVVLGWPGSDGMKTANADPYLEGTRDGIGIKQEGLYLVTFTLRTNAANPIEARWDQYHGAPADSHTQGPVAAYGGDHDIAGYRTYTWAGVAEFGFRYYDDEPPPVISIRIVGYESSTSATVENAHLQVVRIGGDNAFTVSGDS